MFVGALIGVLALPFLPNAAKEYVREGERFADSFVQYARELARTASPTDTSQADPQELEALIHSLVNSQRDQHGLPPLAYDEPLFAIARSHSDDMAYKRFFSHMNLAGQDPSERADKAAYSCVKYGEVYYSYGVGENIYLGSLFSSKAEIGYAVITNWRSAEDLAIDVVQGWMGSPGHRENILTNDYESEGIGVAFGSDDTVLVTQDFC